MGTLESEILKELSAEKAFRHMHFLVNEVGERIAGTPEMSKAAWYIINEMKSFGLDEVRMDRFKIYHSFPGTAELRVLWPETKIIEAKPMCHIVSTTSEGIKGELVYVGAGAYEHYIGKDVRGKIVLVDMTWDPARPEKAVIAAEKGAKALIIMNWGPKDSTVIQMGALKSVWGNPTPETFKKIPQITAIGISRFSGEYLKSLCEKGKVIVWLRADATREWVEAQQPVGKIMGKERSYEFVLVGGHLEAWGKTAICNSSGNSLMLELARVFSKYRPCNRSIVFAFWDGHEIAEAAGSTYFVDTHWNELNTSCIAYLNVDNVGIVGTSVPILRSDPALFDFLEPIVEEVFGRRPIKGRIYKGGDASFFGVGVPYASLYTGYTEEELKRLNYASLSPWLHSEEDTLDKIDKELFEKHLKFYALVLLRLCNVEIIPYNTVAVVEKLMEDLRAVNMIGDERLISDVIDLAGKLKEYIKELHEYKQRLEEKLEKESLGRYKGAIELINRCLIKVNRNLSHILSTVAGKYEQDPYDYTYVKKPIPRLYIPITRLSELEKGSHEYMLWYTKLLREKNMVMDFIQSTMDFLEVALPRIKKEFS